MGGSFSCQRLALVHGGDKEGGNAHFDRFARIGFGVGVEGTNRAGFNQRASLGLQVLHTFFCHFHGTVKAQDTS